MHSLDFYEGFFFRPESITCVFPAIRTPMEKAFCLCEQHLCYCVKTWLVKGLRKNSFIVHFEERCLWGDCLESFTVGGYKVSLFSLSVRNHQLSKGYKNSMYTLLSLNT